MNTLATQQHHYAHVRFADLFLLFLEISCGEKITVSCDWWSLGVLSYELITGKVCAIKQSLVFKRTYCVDTQTTNKIIIG